MTYSAISGKNITSKYLIPANLFVPGWHIFTALCSLSEGDTQLGTPLACVCLLFHRSVISFDGTETMSPSSIACRPPLSYLSLSSPHDPDVIQAPVVSARNKREAKSWNQIIHFQHLIDESSSHRGNVNAEANIAVNERHATQTISSHLHKCNVTS